ncbi:MAG: tRNA (adenosine(37)-N6)-threonylcarbamoyltransferase complex dimerization subunit type 1 TsaB [Gammaproteobacteria bacterium]
MRLIALATAVAEPGLCLRDGAQVVGTWCGPPRCGPELILEAVKDLLAGAGLDFQALDGVACGRGPGAFTGVRLGVALAQGLSLGTGLPLVSVSDLAALAWVAYCHHGWPRVVACLDARQGEVYWGAYVCTSTGIETVGEERIAMPQAVSPPSGDWAWAGNGVPLVASEVSTQALDTALIPNAEAVAELGMQALIRGETTPPAEAMPHYLRERVARPSPRYQRRRTTLVRE